MSRLRALALVLGVAVCGLVSAAPAPASIPAPPSTWYGLPGLNAGTGASVVNQGTIRAKNGGSVVLSGASVSNQGLVEANTGTVVLGGASAFTVDFNGDGLLRYAITAPAGKADNGQTGVSNSGTINANNGGHVVMTARAAADVAGAVVNNTGQISATSTWTASTSARRCSRAGFPTR